MMPNARMVALALLAAGTAACAASPAAAGSFQIDPVKVEISADRKIATIKVKNQADTPVTVRGYALRWTQENGQDAYTQVQNVIVSPPISTIPAGATQLMRVGLRSASPGAYRLIVEEVPQANPGSGVQVALRMDLPLFASLKEGTLSDLSWHAWKSSDGKWLLEAKNNGAGYVRVDAAAASRQTGLALDTKGTLGTVLTNSSRRWPLGAAPHIIDRSVFERIARTASVAEKKSASAQ
ncbi:MAG: hypothetical protein JWN69_2604 [Alphaproteobacteria bacterium]|nr:hypothetical protein [Alphaproteobacteria bacterium]